VSGATIPPPVLLSEQWEKLNIVGKWSWQEQVNDPKGREGELRVFTIGGLTPSIEAGWTSSKILGMMGLGMRESGFFCMRLPLLMPCAHSTEKLELQIGPAEDSQGNPIKWKDVGRDRWRHLDGSRVEKDRRPAYTLPVETVPKAL
jgi:hypothetical protein